MSDHDVIEWQAEPKPAAAPAPESEPPADPGPGLTGLEYRILTDRRERRRELSAQQIEDGQEPQDVMRDLTFDDLIARGLLVETAPEHKHSRSKIEVTDAGQKAIDAFDAFYGPAQARAREKAALPSRPSIGDDEVDLILGLLRADPPWALWRDTPAKTRSAMVKLVGKGLLKKGPIEIMEGAVGFQPTEAGVDACDAWARWNTPEAEAARAFHWFEESLGRDYNRAMAPLMKQAEDMQAAVATGVGWKISRAAEGRGDLFLEAMTVEVIDEVRGWIRGMRIRGESFTLRALRMERFVAEETISALSNARFSSNFMKVNMLGLAKARVFGELLREVRRTLPGPWREDIDERAAQGMAF